MKMRMKSLLFVAVVASCALSWAVEPFVVDFSKEVGSIKKLNGVCNATPIANSRTASINDLVLKLEIPYYRLHDATLENPGIQLVDVRRIFPLFHADANDPQNYDFRATDDYLKQVIDAGAKIEFRLGESIEHSPHQYLVNPPPNYEKWAEICCHIIRHYNEGWANGFKWNIRYWSIWEEPNTNPQLLTGAKDPFTEIYLPLYKVAVTRIKREFPDLKVGGPQSCGPGLVKPFIDYCAANKLPIDFVGFTGYARNPEDYARPTGEIRKYLDEKGYTKTEIAIVEWHWGPMSWKGHGTVSSPRYAKEWSADLTGQNSTAFTAATLIRMQDAPIDYMYFYAMKCGDWGIFDANRNPRGCYYSLLAFAQLAHGETRVEAMTVPAPNWYVVASKEKATGRGYVLVATLRTEGVLWPITLKGGVKPISVKVINPVRDLEEVPDWRWEEKTGGLFIPREIGDSNVWLIETQSI